MSNALAIVVDRLGAGYLGPYGNTWLDTPSLNRLASESLLCEFMQTDSPRLPSVYRSYWHGWHAASPWRDTPSLPQDLTAASMHTCLLTDEAEVADVARIHGFDEVLESPIASASCSCEAMEETHLAQLFATAIAWLEDAPEPFFFWIHSQGMKGPWDAPVELRRQFAGEDDPLPPDFVAPPQTIVGDDTDPDDLLAFQHAYGGQVALLDLCLGVFLDSFHAKGLGKDTLLALTSPRGFPLGEHGVVGLDTNEDDEALLGEVVQVPCILRVPSASLQAMRVQSLTQPADLCATFRQWLDVPSDDESIWGRDLLGIAQSPTPMAFEQAFSVAGNHTAIRTPAWYMYTNPAGRRRLYAKPDDRWEANEVSERCPDIAEQLAEAAGQFQAVAERGRRDDLPPLPEILVES